MDETLSKINNVLHCLNINAKCVNVKKYRHLAFCDIVLHPGQKVRSLESSAREIGLALNSKTTPIVNLNSSRGCVQLQYAIDDIQPVELHDLFKIYNTPDNMILPFLLGETAGEPVWLDMAKNPHLLIAGGTGSGKSTLLHTLISNVIKFDGDVWVYLVDPKNGVEFSVYEENDVCNFLAKDYESAIFLLEELYSEMERRYDFLKRKKLTSIEQNPQLLPKILIVIDEIADLMLQDKNKKSPHYGKFEHLLCSIAQKSRAAGIYCVIATQRPSVDVVTGLIKANFPARISCKVSSRIDSKIVIDSVGAESLLGRGDAIVRAGNHDFLRFQVACSDFKRLS